MFHHTLTISPATKVANGEIDIWQSRDFGENYVSTMCGVMNKVESPI
jgi:hypothetical protein